MSKFEVKNTEGTTVASAELAAEVYGIEPNIHVMHHIVKCQMACWRQGTQSTKGRSDVSTYYSEDAVSRNSLVADGCMIEGTVENSVIFRGVRVERGAVVKNCIIMQDTVVGENARLDYVVADKDVVFDMNRVLTGHQNYPVYVAKGSRV